MSGLTELASKLDAFPICDVKREMRRLNEDRHTINTGVVAGITVAAAIVLIVSFYTS